MEIIWIFQQTPEGRTRPKYMSIVVRDASWWGFDLSRFIFFFLSSPKCSYSSGWCADGRGVAHTHPIAVVQVWIDPLELDGSRDRGECRMLQMLTYRSVNHGNVSICRSGTIVFAFDERRPDESGSVNQRVVLGVPTSQNDTESICMLRFRIVP